MGDFGATACSAAGRSALPFRAPFPLETSMPGVFAVGDARYRSIKRVASAVGDGATAVRLAHEYLTTAHADELSLTPHG